MSYLIWLARLCLFLALLALATHNLQPVSVTGFLGLVWQAPLAVVLLLVFAIGLLVGALAVLRLTWRWRRSPAEATPLGAGPVAPGAPAPEPASAARIRPRVAPSGLPADEAGA